jgi:hypothetical protein
MKLNSYLKHFSTLTREIITNSNYIHYQTRVSLCHTVTVYEEILLHKKYRIFFIIFFLSITV